MNKNTQKQALPKQPKSKINDVDNPVDNPVENSSIWLHMLSREFWIIQMYKMPYWRRSWRERSTNCFRLKIHMIILNVDAVLTKHQVADAQKKGKDTTKLMKAWLVVYSATTKKMMSMKIMQHRRKRHRCHHHPTPSAYLRIHIRENNHHSKDYLYRSCSLLK